MTYRWSLTSEQTTKTKKEKTTMKFQTANNIFEFNTTATTLEQAINYFNGQDLGATFDVKDAYSVDGVYVPWTLLKNWKVSENSVVVFNSVSSDAAAPTATTVAAAAESSADTVANTVTVTYGAGITEPIVVTITPGTTLGQVIYGNSVRARIGKTETQIRGSKIELNGVEVHDDSCPLNGNERIRISDRVAGDKGARITVHFVYGAGRITLHCPSGSTIEDVVEHYEDKLQDELFCGELFYEDEEDCGDADYAVYVSGINAAELAEDQGDEVWASYILQDGDTVYFDQYEDDAEATDEWDDEEEADSDDWDEDDSQEPAGVVFAEDTPEGRAMIEEARNTPIEEPAHIKVSVCVGAGINPVEIAVAPNVTVKDVLENNTVLCRLNLNAEGVRRSNVTLNGVACRDMTEHVHEGDRLNVSPRTCGDKGIN